MYTWHDVAGTDVFLETGYSTNQIQYLKTEQKILNFYYLIYPSID